MGSPLCVATADVDTADVATELTEAMTSGEVGNKMWTSGPGSEVIASSAQ